MDIIKDLIYKLEKLTGINISNLKLFDEIMFSKGLEKNIIVFEFLLIANCEIFFF